MAGIGFFSHELWFWVIYVLLAWWKGKGKGSSMYLCFIICVYLLWPFIEKVHLYRFYLIIYYKKN